MTQRYANIGSVLYAGTHHSANHIKNDYRRRRGRGRRCTFVQRVPLCWTRVSCWYTLSLSFTSGYDRPSTSLAQSQGLWVPLDSPPPPRFVLFLVSSALIRSQTCREEPAFMDSIASHPLVPFFSSRPHPPRLFCPFSLLHLSSARLLSGRGLNSCTVQHV